MMNWKGISLRFFLVLVLGISGLPTAGSEEAGVSLRDLSIPEELGKINERFEGKSGSRWVIQIQDIHAHFTAQENIGAIVDHLQNVYGLNVVALEGGWAEARFTESSNLPNTRDKQMLARGLLEEAHIGGPVFAALFASHPLQIVGIEDPALYADNLAVYTRHMEMRLDVLKKVDAMMKDLAREKRAAFNPDLLAFDEALSSFREGEKAEIFLPELVNRAETARVDLTPFDQVVLFRDILRREKSIHRDKLQKEAARIMNDFKQSQLTFEEILRAGKVAHEKLAYYPQSRQYLELMQMQDDMEHRRFFDQIEAVIEKVQEKLIRNENEKRISEKSKRLHIAKTLLLFHATPDTLRKYEALQAEVKTILAANGLTDALDLALEFYRFAHARDEIFYEKLQEDPRLAGSVAVVTGGFHTEGLSKLLREAGTSYIVITPELGGNAADEELYFKRLQDPVPMSYALSHEKNRYVFLDANFPKGVDILRRSNNIYDGIATATRYQLTGGRNAPQAPLPGSLTFEKFSAMSPEERLKEVQELFRAAKQARKPIAIVIKNTVLRQLLENPVGRVLWAEIIAPERANRIVIVRDSDEYLEATIGIGARVERVQGDMPIPEILATRLKNQDHIAVIDDGFFQEQRSGKFLPLPAEPVSLLLARTLLENGNRRIAVENDLLASFEEELSQFFKAEGLFRKYA